MNRKRLSVGVLATTALAALAYRIGLTEIAAQFRNLHLVAPVVLVAGLIRLWLQTRAWQIALAAEGVNAPQSRLIAIRLASQAAGYLAALGPVVSEPTKLVLLRSPGGAAAAAPATLFETGAFWYTTALLGLAGVCAMAFLVATSAAIWVGAAIFAAALVLLTVRRSALGPLVRATGQHTPRWLRFAESMERRIRSFRERHPQAARRVLALDTVAQLLTLPEVAAVLWAAGRPASMLHVLAIEAAGRLVKILGVWIPGRIGADEGGAAAAFALLGLPPAAGLMLVLARRVRDLLWCGAGVVWAAKGAPVPLCMEER